MDSSKEQIRLLKRPLTEAELDHVVEVVVRQMREVTRQGHPLGHLVDPERVHEWLEGMDWAEAFNPNLDVFVADNDHIVGILGWAVSTIPWSAGKALKELIVLAVDHNYYGFGRLAVKRLQELALKYDCCFIETGSAFCLDPRLLENLYKVKGGYQWSYPNFIKVL